MTITAILKVVLTKAIFLIIYVCWLNFIVFSLSVGGIMVSIAAFQAVDPGSIPGRRKTFLEIFFLIFLIVWYGAKHKKCYFKILKNVFLKKLSMPWPGFEPGLLRPQRRVLTTRRSRLRTDIVLWPWNVCILFNSTI